MGRVISYLRFYNELNRHRKARGLAWNKVATRAGVAPSNVHIFVRQFEESSSAPVRGLSLENLVKLLDWMNQTDLAPYLVLEDDPEVLTK